MSSTKPEKIVINHDDYYAKHVGVTKDGLQFFLTAPFESASKDSKGCEYIALFKFDEDGNLVDSIINTLGPRDSFLEADAKERYYTCLKELGELEYCRIKVKPFCIKHNGIDMGLIVRESESEVGTWAAELLPGNYMAFFEPWDSGEYDT